MLNTGIPLDSVETGHVLSGITRYHSTRYLSLNNKRCLSLHMRSVWERAASMEREISPAAVPTPATETVAPARSSTSSASPTVRTRSTQESAWAWWWWRRQRRPRPPLCFLQTPVSTNNRFFTSPFLSFLFFIHAIYIDFLISIFLSPFLRFLGFVVSLTCGWDSSYLIQIEIEVI